MWAAFAIAVVLAWGDRVPIGSAVGDLRFTDTRHLRRALSDFGSRKAFVLVFTTTDCPLVGRYLPRLSELERRYRPLGVQFVAVDVGRGSICAVAGKLGICGDVALFRGDADMGPVLGTQEALATYSGVTLGFASW